MAMAATSPAKASRSSPFQRATSGSLAATQAPPASRLATIRRCTRLGSPFSLVIGLSLDVSTWTARRRPQLQAVPDQAVPDQAVPDQAVPDQAVPDHAVPFHPISPVTISGVPSPLRSAYTCMEPRLPSRVP